MFLSYTLLQTDDDAKKCVDKHFCNTQPFLLSLNLWKSTRNTPTWSLVHVFIPGGITKSVTKETLLFDALYCDAFCCLHDRRPEKYFSYQKKNFETNKSMKSTLTSPSERQERTTTCLKNAH